MHPTVHVETLDTHTAGEPTRIVTNGVGVEALGAGSVADKRDRFATDHDELRRFLLWEPRGHDDMFGAIPVPPGDDRADLGLVFMDGGGYLDMCGHATIGAITALIEDGRLNPADSIVVETPAGLVTTRPSVVDGRVEGVAVESVDSYVCDAVTVSVPVGGERRSIPVDLVVSGNLFALVDVGALDRSVDRDTVDELVALAGAIRTAIDDAHRIVDPLTGEERSVATVELYESSEPADRNVVVFGEGQVDRSPCGSGTCAKMTLLFERGELGLEEPYPAESVIGTRFTGRLLDVDERDGTSVTTPEVTGSAHLTGRHTFVRDERDELEPFSLTARQ